VRSPRVLLLKLAALGDVVMASTMIGAVRRRWPSAEITWAVGRGYAAVVRSFEGVDRIVELDEAALLGGGTLARGLAAVRATAALGPRAYDLAIVAHQDPRYTQLLAFTRTRDVRTMADPGATSGANSGVWMGADYARLVPDTDPTDLPLARVRARARSAAASTSG
jgi:ADP-heptose:LPS heptosyltransferase